MHTAKGKTRFVIVFPKLGFVIKFPIIWLSVFKHAYRDCRHGNWNYMWSQWGIRVENPYGYPNKLLNGIWSNLLEFFFWQKTKHALLYPTWFTFFGLNN
jgi:hypothetical protein